MLTVWSVTITVCAVIAAMQDSAATELSVEGLAEASGVSVRTIRWYQSEGLLPPPERHGREVRYSAAHLERLNLVAELQRRGLRLSAIADLLQRSPTASTADWLGLGEALDQPRGGDRPELLSEDELARRVEPGQLEDFVAAGFAERRDDTVPVVYLVPSPGLLDVAVAWRAAGLDLDAAARFADLLAHHLRAMADELVARFTEEVSLRRLAGEGPGGLARLLNQVRPLTHRTVEVLLAHEMQRASRATADADPDPSSDSPEVHP